MRKVPKKPKAKGKRWPKGHSSSSNPETKKFREAAKSRFFQYESSGPSSLTVGALKTLDAFNNRKYGEKEPAKELESCDGTSVSSWTSSKTFKTFASDWSDCSNASFNRLIKNFDSKSFLHKEMLAVLAAVTEIIKSNGGKETSTEYFAALITTLGVTDVEETVAAILSLLSMGIKTVPNEVLRLKFSETSKVLLDILAKYSELENPVILRATIGCLSVILRAQDAGTWSYPSTQQIFHSILIFSTHSKPKVRKAAQHAVCAILKASSLFTAEEIHPGAVTVAKYCIKQMEDGTVLGGSTSTLHILTLLKEVIGCFPKNFIKTTCESLLKLMTLGSPIVVTCSLEVFHGLFTLASTVHLDSTLNAKILNALYDYQPSINDAQATLAWLTVMQEAYRALGRRDPALCCENLVKFFSVGTNLWLNDNGQILNGSTSCLRVVGSDCIKACSDCVRYCQMCQNVFGIVENCLKYQFNNVWIQVFSLLGVLYEVIGKDGEEYMRSSIKALGDLRESHNFLYMTELDFTIGKAIRSLGPETVLKCIPIVITGKELNFEFKTSWLLPILKDNIQRSSLKFFIDYFLPLASLCETKVVELNTSNNKIGAHSYDLLQLQIWSLLPAFCSSSNDIKENFKTIAKILGDLIAGRKHLRIQAMAALRKAITKNQSLNNNENLAELSRFSKNYLPILFNLYLMKPTGTDESGERLAAYETIKVYLSITDPEQRESLYDKALMRIKESDQDAFLKESLMDLLKILVPYQTEEKLQITYEISLETLKTTKSAKEGKKFYRLLEVIVGSNSDNCKKFTEGKRKEIFSFLLKAIKDPKALNRGARLRCILHMVKILPKNSFNTIKALIPEAVVCCKDINKRTRTFAFRLIEEMFYLTRTWSDKSNEDAIRDYLSMIVTGLAGSSSLCSATILALGKMTHVLKSDIPSDVLQLVVENISLICSLPNRETVGPALGYLKIFLTSLPKDQALHYVPTLVNAIVSMTMDCKNHFRLKTRDVLDRLIRKFGYDIIHSLVPAEDSIMQKRLKNIKRLNMKKNAKKLESEKDDTDFMEEFSVKAKPKSIEEILASSDESEDETEENDQRKKQKEKTTLFIQEDADNIVDFSSPYASSKISAAIPVAKKKEKKESDFKIASDGRMIIMDKTSENDSDNDVLDDNSDVEDLAVKLDNVLSGRKRKLSTSSDVSSKYQAGGSGIHRPINAESSAGKSKKTKKGKKNSEISNLKTGSEYRAKKARGDIKLKGKPDPFAYIPLSRKLLNRRKKMKNIVQSAIKGAKIGAKLKMKKKRK